ncbi:Uncharacterised protein [Mycobacteroides abscessus subsp. abscessus]|nr:Uncharacterised protein [Mycobacteroides abscessus subsp. abscessus]
MNASSAYPACHDAIGAEEAELDGTAARQLGGT